MQFFRIFHADPNPGSAASLSTPAKEQANPVTPDTGEVFVAPRFVLESKGIHIKRQACLHVFNAQDGLRPFKSDFSATIFRHLGLHKIAKHTICLTLSKY